jgi:hypothetical protein
MVDDFAIDLAEAVKVLERLAVSDSTIGKVITEAVSNEILYRFAGEKNNPTTKSAMLALLTGWCNFVHCNTNITIDIQQFILE